jgi:hypothetical protein
MPPKSLTELAQNPDLISGIYNYCDRWCERCPLTSRCLVYATESEFSENEIEDNDISNAQFWHALNDTLTEVRALIPVWAKEAQDLNDPAQQHTVRRHTRAVDNHPLTKAGKRYANAASDWFRELDQPNDSSTNVGTEKPQPFEDARQVIQWYQYQIAVKTIRALSARNEDDAEDNDVPKDSDGSAKVALIGIDRSIAAWHLMQLSLSDRAESIVPLILQLDSLRTKLEGSFPEARAFVRPGFDQVATA